MAKKTEIAITAKELRMVPVEALVPYANNAKIHSPEQIAKLHGEAAMKGLDRLLRRKGGGLDAWAQTER